MWITCGTQETYNPQVTVDNRHCDTVTVDPVYDSAQRMTLSCPQCTLQIGAHDYFAQQRALSSLSSVGLSNGQCTKCPQWTMTMNSLFIVSLFIVHCLLWTFCALSVVTLHNMDFGRCAQWTMRVMQITL